MKIITRPGAETFRRRLLLLGAVLFFLGLISGVTTGMMINPRMGLSAHLEGVMNGILLLVVAAVWGWIRLTALAQWILFWSLAIGTSLNWLAIQLAALWGTGSMTPIAAAEFQAKPWQEAMVSDALVIVTISMLVGGVLLIIGFIQRPRDTHGTTDSVD